MDPGAYIVSPMNFSGNLRGKNDDREAGGDGADLEPEAASRSTQGMQGWDAGIVTAHKVSVTDGASAF